MKKLFLSIVSLFIAVLLQAAVTKTVTGNAAGGLTTALTALEKSTVTNLTISGTMDARDFKTMRDSMPALAVVDLSGANIASYTGTLGTLTSSSYSYPANTIPYNAFYTQSTGVGKPSLTSITISSTVTEIGSGAFQGCTGITEMVIPSSVTSIYYTSFEKCGGAIAVDPSNANYSSVDGDLYNKDKTSLIHCNISKSGSYTIASTVTSLGRYAFYYCSNLTSITCPASLTTIGIYAFAMCGNVTTINIPSPSVVSIEGSVFTQCNKLTSINIPSGVTSMGDYLFEYCNALTSMYAYPTTPVDLSLSTNAFLHLNQSTCTLYVPSGSKAAYAAATAWKDFTNIVELNISTSAVSVSLANTSGSNASVTVTTGLKWTPASNQTWLTVNPNTATSGNGTLTLTANSDNTGSTLRSATVTLSANGAPSKTITVTQVSVTKTIAISAGGLSSGLLPLEKNLVTNLTITGTMDARDFKTMRDSMPALAVVDLRGASIASYTGTLGTLTSSSYSYPENTIPYNAFYTQSTGVGKPSLTSITISSTVTEIGSGAFQGCTGITDMVIPSTVTSIYYTSFEKCGGAITVDPSNANYSSVDGDLYNKDKTSLIHCNISKSGSYTIASTVTSLGRYAFYYCSNLTSITCPASLTTIGIYAFAMCGNVTTINIPSPSVVSIEGSVFTQCNKLTSINIPSGVTSMGDYLFEYCNALTSMYAYPTTPVDLSLSTNAFLHLNQSTCTLYVPSGSKAAYATVPVWNAFSKIVEMSLDVTSDAVNIGSTQGSTANDTVISGLRWIATSNQTWLTISPNTDTSGNATLTLTASANLVLAARTAIVTITSSGFLVSKTISVTQAGDTILLVSANSANIANANNSTSMVSVTSNTKWTATSNQTWLTVSPNVTTTGNAALTLTATANPTIAERTATVTISAIGATSQTVTVTQTAGAATLLVSAATANVAAAINSKDSVAVTSNTSWTATSNQTWLTVSPNLATTGNAVLTLTTTANPTIAERIATITISAVGVTSQTVTVTQTAGAATLWVSATTANVAATINSKDSVAVTSNTSWTATSDQNWLTVSPGNATTGNATLVFIASANPTPTVRTATVTLSATGVSPQTVKVTQAAGAVILSVSVTKATVAATDNSMVTIDVTSNTSWTVASDQTWLTISPNVATTGNATLTFTASANPTATDRSATVTLSSPGVNFIAITVTQTGGSGTSVATILNNNVTTYPNPAMESFKITGFEGTASLSIFNLNGANLLQMQVSNDEKVAINKLPKGMYIMKLQTSNGTKEIKLIKE